MVKSIEDQFMDNNSEEVKAMVHLEGDKGSKTFPCWEYF